jgi:hypothetical protein
MFLCFYCSYALLSHTTDVKFLNAIAMAGDVARREKRKYGTDMNDRGKPSPSSSSSANATTSEEVKNTASPTMKKQREEDSSNGGDKQGDESGRRGGKGGQRGRGRGRGRGGRGGRSRGGPDAPFWKLPQRVREMVLGAEKQGVNIQVSFYAHKSHILTSHRNHICSMLRSTVVQSLFRTFEYPDQFHNIVKRCKYFPVVQCSLLRCD